MDLSPTPGNVRVRLVTMNGHVTAVRITVAAPRTRAGHGAASGVCQARARTAPGFDTVLHASPRYGSSVSRRRAGLPVARIAGRQRCALDSNRNHIHSSRSAGYHLHGSAASVPRGAARSRGGYARRSCQTLALERPVVGDSIGQLPVDREGRESGGAERVPRLVPGVGVPPIGLATDPGNRGLDEATEETKARTPVRTTRRRDAACRVDERTPHRPPANPPLGASPGASRPSSATSHVARGFRLALLPEAMKRHRRFLGRSGLRVDEPETLAQHRHIGGEAAWILGVLSPVPLVNSPPVR